MQCNGILAEIGRVMIFGGNAKGNLVSLGLRFGKFILPKWVIKYLLVNGMVGNTFKFRVNLEYYRYQTMSAMP